MKQGIVNLMRRLPNPRGFSVALTAIFLMASVSALRLAFDMGSTYETYRCVYPSMSPGGPLFTRLKLALSFEGEAFLLVTLALIFSAVGLWSRRVLGFLLSLIALACLGGIYILWYRATFSLMQTFGARDFSEMWDRQQDLLPLQGATWWDIVVLGVALILFVWQVVMLKRILKPVAPNSENQSTAKSD